MAMTPEEKKAYNREYYQKYKKKGLKKGRKKSTKTKTSSSNKSLLATTTAGLSTEGKMKAQLIKEDFKKQMNDALKNAKTDEERKQIRLDYSKRAIAEIEKLKSDPANVKQKATKTKTSSGSPKKSSSGSSKSSDGSSKSSSGSSKSPESSKSSGGSDKSSSTKKSNNTKKSSNTKKSNSQTAEPEEIISTEEDVMDLEKASLTQITDMVSKLSSSLQNLTEEQKTVVRNQISDIIDVLKKRLTAKLTGVTNG